MDRRHCGTLWTADNRRRQSGRGIWAQYRPGAWGHPTHIDAEFNFVMDVNVKGTLSCLRAQLPPMQKDSEGRSSEAIVNTASVTGIMGVEYNGPYVASKHAIVGMTRTATKEEGARVIRVNAIAL